ncbi:MAG TPA: hypothetical protein VEZ14_09330 [Dehalococcoidia bacterium]|nr:hypothetical protein [Dehalococcoidia bacterium]
MARSILTHRLALPTSIAFAVVLVAGVVGGRSAFGFVASAIVAGVSVWACAYAITRAPSPLDQFWRRALPLNLLLWSPLGVIVFVRTLVLGGLGLTGPAIAGGLFVYSVMFVPVQFYIQWLRPKVERRRQARADREEGDFYSQVLGPKK